MKVIFLIYLLTFLGITSYAQLKDENFLMVENCPNIRIFNSDKAHNTFISVDDTGFKNESNLSFMHLNISADYCCNYYEVKQIPKGWNIITVKDIVAHMEDKRNAFRFNTKKLFFVEYDKERRIYKAYQADIIGWPRTDWHLNLPGDAYKGLMLQGLQDSNYYKDNILISTETKSYNGATYTLAKYYNQI